QTIHSTFKIPLKVEASTTCIVDKESNQVELIRQAIAIIWDEASMARCYAIEAMDWTFRDITVVDLVFGGKVMILGNDFQQVLSVVPSGTKLEMINAFLVKSTMWKDVRVLFLKQNMRSRSDEDYSNFILRVSKGNEVRGTLHQYFSKRGIPKFGKLSKQCFIYGGTGHTHSKKNDNVDKLNEKIIGIALYQREYLNFISPASMPPHALILKNGAPIMLLRNLDPKSRLIVIQVSTIVDAKILTGQFARTKVFLPRVPLKTSENINLPFVTTRRQFTIRLSFVLMINESQGHTISNVDVYIPEYVFSHGQLYVALSRGVCSEKMKLLVKKENLNTRRMVHKQTLFTSIQV
ncbi:PIF1 domain-containing protein, partial [Cephalotus follicularis]